jgi:hypothetical protein
VRVTLRPIKTPWDATAVTYNTMPRVRVPRAASGPFHPNEYQAATITGWVKRWAAGAWPNYGIRLTGPPNGLVKLGAALGPVANGSPSSYIEVKYQPARSSTCRRT